MKALDLRAVPGGVIDEDSRFELVNVGAFLLRYYFGQAPTRCERYAPDVEAAGRVCALHAMGARLYGLEVDFWQHGGYLSFDRGRCGDVVKVDWWAELDDALMPNELLVADVLCVTSLVAEVRTLAQWWDNPDADKSTLAIRRGGRGRPVDPAIALLEYGMVSWFKACGLPLTYSGCEDNVSARVLRVLMGWLDRSRAMPRVPHRRRHLKTRIRKMLWDYDRWETDLENDSLLTDPFLRAWWVATEDELRTLYPPATAEELEERALGESLCGGRTPSETN